MQQDWDKALVRHIYGVHCIITKKPEAKDASVSAFATLTAGDVQEFGYQDTAFASHPSAVLKSALHQIAGDAQSREEYNQVLLPLVYGKGKFSFGEACGSFVEIAKRLVNSLQSLAWQPLLLKGCRSCSLWPQIPLWLGERVVVVVIAWAGLCRRLL